MATSPVQYLVAPRFLAVALMMPVLIVLSLRFLSPGYLDVMYGTAAGRIMMTGCLGLVAAAYYSIERITDIAV